jgi:alcohol dehydrogenase (cytochrome c)
MRNDVDWPRGGVLIRLALGSVLLYHAQSSFAADYAITPAPPFSAAQLNALPEANWITNGGSLRNQRYSPLSLLNRGNIADLKALWRTSMGSGKDAINSGQAQILVYEGVLFVVNGADDVFAMDVETGKIIWVYRGNPDPRSGSPVGKGNRGVALGDGKVFMGQHDGRVVALDQMTGAVAWAITAARWQDGYDISSAPLYYDGLVIVGFAGGEVGTRGRLEAYDAKTGAKRWTFYTVPGPGMKGHETWPQDTDAWMHGGAATWQTPAVDSDLGLLYVSTGNPGPDLNGSVRQGDNLYANSIIAIEAKTGKYRWHFQQVHHDLWDYDSANPVVLVEADIGGVRRQGLVEVSKTGWAYILDRTDGTPLIGIEEKAVVQEPRQATSATQPYPIGDSIVPQEVDVVPEDSLRIAGTGEIPNHGRIFTPYWTEPVSLKPGALGGANGPPSSYDPESNLLYVCASDRIFSYALHAPLEAPSPGQIYLGGAFSQSSASDRGIFAALDVRTNRIQWRQQWREVCYSGSVVTRGGLLFVGRTDGRLTALDKTTGVKLWEFRTDAGVNTTVTTFEHNHKQYVAVHAGGSTFANGKRGDGVWMFSLDGKIGPVGLSADSRMHSESARPPATRAISAAHGERIYKQACVPCHGQTGAGGHGGGPSLIAGQDPDNVAAIASTGRNNMPSFAAIYSSEDLRDVAAYIVDELAGMPSDRK